MGKEVELKDWLTFYNSDLEIHSVPMKKLTGYSKEKLPGDYGTNPYKQQPVRTMNQVGGLAKASPFESWKSRYFSQNTKLPNITDALEQGLNSNSSGRNTSSINLKNMSPIKRPVHVDGTEAYTGIAWNSHQKKGNAKLGCSKIDPKSYKVTTDSIMMMQDNVIEQLQNQTPNENTYFNPSRVFSKT